MSLRALLLTAALALFGCAPSPEILLGGRINCLRFNVFDAVTGTTIQTARVTVRAEIERSTTFLDVDYPIWPGCTGEFLVIVEAPGYERYQSTHRSFMNRDFTTNQVSQHIRIGLRPQSDSAASDAASGD